ncbi:hypothetical protein [Inediibacterium massiliense]|uniref:hypothetical protein n=1 Tax=Inediibacterium massiliense TaxID=1658111 RepID=UPI0018FF0323|nr:hypothetical protein [Inediibacterium massiliense]
MKIPKNTKAFVFFTDIKYKIKNILKELLGITSTIIQSFGDVNGNKKVTPHSAAMQVV